MKSYVRFRRNPTCKYPPSRYRMILPKIGYLYRAEGRILSDAHNVADADCRDGAVLRVPPQSFIDIYYTKMLPNIRNDAEQEAAAVYFDPYVGRYIVVGAKQLYLDAKEQFRTAGTPLFLEKETAFSFDPMTYGAFFDADREDNLTFDDYFAPDITGETIADCMTDPTWNMEDNAYPGNVHPCAENFFVYYADKLLSDAQRSGPDTLTTLLAAIIANGHHALLARLFVLIPQITARFRPTLQEEEKFAAIRVPSDTGTNQIRIFNLFNYALLCGSTDIIETIFCFYERPGELTEFVRHPMYYPVGFHHIRTHNAGALSQLLSKNYYPDAVDVTNNRIPLLSAACRAASPGMVSHLLAAGADPEKRDTRGNAAFDYAAANGNCAILSMLLSSLKAESAREWAMSLAENLPLGDDNQALLGVLKKFLS